MNSPGEIWWSNELVLAEAVEKCNGINDMVLINRKQVSQLMVACLPGNPEYVKELLKVPGIKIELQNDNGWHALMFACLLPHSLVAKLLLNACQHALQVVNLPNKDGVTSLIVAAHNGHTETVSLLLQRGANVNQQDIDGRTSLMMASQNGHTETVLLLLQNSANVNMQDKLFSDGGKSKRAHRDSFATAPKWCSNKYAGQG